MTEERTETTRVVEDLAAARGYTLEALAEEIARHGHHDKEEALGYFTDCREAGPVWFYLVTDILGLVWEEKRRFFYALMADAGNKASEARC